MHSLTMRARMEWCSNIFAGKEKKGGTNTNFLGQRGVDLFYKDSVLSESLLASTYVSQHRTETVIIRIPCNSSLSSFSAQFDCSNMKISPKFGIPTDPVLNEQILRHAGKISYARFQVSHQSAARFYCF